MSEVRKPLIFLFGYKARRGKDTACKAIVAARGESVGVRHYAFADALREEINCAVFDRWVQDRPNETFEADKAMRHLCAWAGVEYVENAQIDTQYPYGKQRPLLQWWGMSKRRINPRYWVEKMETRIAIDNPRAAVVSDLRFFNEFDFGHYRIRMDRPGFEIEDGAHHVSECQLDVLPVTAWDYVITSSTPQSVEAQAVTVFDLLLWQRERLASNAISE